MDPSQLDAVSLIVGALAAGAGDGVKDVTKGTVVRAANSVSQGALAARQKLVGLVRDRFGDDEDAAADLNVYLRRPSLENAEVLSDHILGSGLDHDQEVLDAAGEVLNQVGPMAIGPGSVAGTIISSMNAGAGQSHIGGVQQYGGSLDPR